MQLKSSISRFFEILKVIAFRFQKDLCFLRTSALTFSTALAFVPLLAVMFGVAKGFGINVLLENMIRSEFRDQEQVIQYLIQFGYQLLEQTRGGIIAGVGIITLFYTVLKLLSTIEDSLNSMWGQKEGRTLGRKVIDFLALILLLPIFFVISGSITVFITAHLTTFFKDSGAIVGQVQPLMIKALSLIPYVISTALFTFLYMYMPNRRVSFRSALLAGFIAGSAYQVLQAWYIFVQISLTKTGAIYGSFAALPLFLVWLYFSWLIFLVGAEIVVAHQERLWDPEMITPQRALSRFEKELAFLAITKACVDAMLADSPPLTLQELSATLKMPMRLLSELIEELSTAGIVTRTTTGVAIIRNPEQLKLFDVLMATAGQNEIAKDGKAPLLESFEKYVHALEKPVQSCDKNLFLKEIPS